jgi:hypothetical protein
MKPSFQFTLRRALFCTTFTAFGAASWPIATRLDSYGYHNDALIFFLFLGSYALPLGGIGSLLGRGLDGLCAGFAIGLIVGLYF